MHRPNLIYLDEGRNESIDVVATVTKCHADMPEGLLVFQKVWEKIRNDHTCILRFHLVDKCKNYMTGIPGKEHIICSIAATFVNFVESAILESITLKATFS